MTALVTEPGVVLDLPEATYHADRESLSVSGAKKLLPPSCPAIFRYEQDNPPPPKDVFDFGSAAHALLLGSGGVVTQVDAKDWRGKAAQEERDRIRAAGEIPILRDDLQRALAMVAAVHADPVAGPLFTDGAPEVSAFWQDGELWRRARFDWLGQETVVDYKTAACAEPDTFARACGTYHYDMQAAWYLDGAAALNLDADRFLFVAQEKTPPYLVSVVELDAASLAAGRVKNAHALNVYATCRAFDEWPGYSDGVRIVRLPEWSLRWSA